MIINAMILEKDRKTDKAVLQCNSCSHMFIRSYSETTKKKSSIKCPECTKISNFKLSEKKYAKKYLLNRRVNGNFDISCAIHPGETIKLDTSNFSKIGKCKVCTLSKLNALHNSFRKTIEQYNAEIKPKNLITNEYLGEKTRTNHTCTKCSRQFMISPSSVLWKGRGCGCDKHFRSIDVFGKIIRTRGYEDHGIKWLMDNKYITSCNVDKVVFDLNPGRTRFIEYFDSVSNKNKKYYPDIVLGCGTVVEIKSLTTIGINTIKDGVYSHLSVQTNVDKFKSVVKTNKFILLVFTRYGKLIKTGNEFFDSLIPEVF